MTLFKAPVAILSVAALLAVSVPAYAQTPPDLRDLVGARAGQAEGAVQSRGYEFVRTQEGGNSKWSYWRRGNDCVQITTTDGRYAAIDRMTVTCATAAGRATTAAIRQPPSWRAWR